MDSSNISECRLESRDSKMPSITQPAKSSRASFKAAVASMSCSVRSSRSLTKPVIGGTTFTVELETAWSLVRQAPRTTAVVLRKSVNIDR